ncbi:MAG: hypothetical protein GY906_13075 [bacterium]|nr:hypothetical protein [bacterium]
MPQHPNREAFWNTMPKSLAVQGVNVFVGRGLRGLLKTHVKQLEVDLHRDLDPTTADKVFELVRDNIYGWPS